MLLAIGGGAEAGGNQVPCVGRCVKYLGQQLAELSNKCRPFMTVYDVTALKTIPSSLGGGLFIALTR